MRREEKSEQNAQLATAAQTVTMLVIDKKRMPIMDAGFPQVVPVQTPKMMRRSKVPVVKTKIGPRIISMIVDEKIFDDIPVKKEVHEAEAEKAAAKAQEDREKAKSSKGKNNEGKRPRG